MRGKKIEVSVYGDERVKTRFLFLPTSLPFRRKTYKDKKIVKQIRWLERTAIVQERVTYGWEDSYWKDE